MVERTLIERRLDSVGWGLFFVWVGIALLLDVGWGPGLLGVGIITLGMQGTRYLNKLRIEVFWFAAGVIFLLGGIFNLAKVEVSLLPILLIIAGVALLISELWKK